MRIIKYVKMSAMLIGVVLGMSSGTANAWLFGYATDGSVSSTVTLIGSGSWQYQFTVSNTSPDQDAGNFPYLGAIEIPYFGDAGITNITAPIGWSASVWDGQAFNTTQALAWEADVNNMLPRGQSLSGFSFTAPFAPVKAPYQLIFAGGPPVLGDPAMPGSPAAWAAGFTTPFPVTAVPEPEIYAMMLAGLGLLGFVARRRKQQQASA